MSVQVHTILFLIVLCWCFNISLAAGIAEKKCSEYRQLKLGVPLMRYANCSDVTPSEAKAAELGEFPHYALLGWFRPNNPDRLHFRCGGALISERFVLTAAHCLKKGPPDVARLGDIQSTDELNDQVDFRIESAERHQKHKMSQSYHDIALIKLNQTVTFSYRVRPACLWMEQKWNNTLVISTGFGSTDPEAYELSKTMQKISLNVLNKQSCQAQFSGDRKLPQGIKDGQLCVGSITHRSDACQGDSGGPLVVRNDPASCLAHVVAVSSSGAACGVGNSAAVCTRISTHRKWIEGIVWPNTTMEKIQPNQLV